MRRKPVKEKVKRLLGLLFIYTFMPLLGGGILCLAYMIPEKYALQNLCDSEYYINNLSLAINPVMSETYYDRFTNSLMLNQAVCITGKEPLVEAMADYFYICGDAATDSPYETLQLIARGQKDSLNVIDYERYWHGYLIFLKPMLSVFSLENVVRINALLQIGVCFLNFFLLAKQSKELTIPYFVMYICLQPAVIAYSFQYSTIYYVMQIALFMFLRHRDFIEKYNLYVYFFSLVGMITSYMDLLTYPVISLCIPLLFVVLTENKNAFHTMVYACCWGAGYLGMWLGKWILGSLVLHENLLSEAIGYIKFRTSSISFDKNQEASFFKTLKLNIAEYDNAVIYMLLLVILVLVVCKCIRMKNIVIKWNEMVSVILIGAVPFLWYLAVKNHSYIHYWMTYRNLAASLAAAASILILIERKDSLNAEEEK